MECKETTLSVAKFYNSISIKFLHRTARDFLTENETGKSFINDNTAHTFNPYAWQYYAKLLKAILLTPREKMELGSVMAFASKAERHTGEAQTALFQTLDVLMTAKYQDWNAEYQGWNAEYQARMHENPMRALHWTDMLPVALLIGNGDGGGVYYFQDTSGFLGYYGIKHTVLNIIDSPKYQHDREYRHYILGCAMLGLGRIRFEEQSMRAKLIVSLLERGADPNVTVRAWKDDQPSETRAFEATLRDLWDMFTWRTDSWSVPAVVAIERLLAAGADTAIVLKDLLDSRCWYLNHSETLCRPRFGRAGATGRTTRAKATGYDNVEETCPSIHSLCPVFSMSVASLLRVCLGKSPGYREVEAILEKQGAVEEVVMTQLCLDLPCQKIWTLSPSRAMAHQEVVDVYLTCNGGPGKNPPEELKTVISENFDLVNFLGADPEPRGEDY